MEKSLDFYQSVMEKSLNSEIDIDCIDQYIYMSNSHYNRLTQIQSLLFCYLFIIQLKITK